MSEEKETVPTAPAWMASQTPKTDTMPPASGEKKARKPRRTKEQMLADAAARPDAQIAGTVDGAIVHRVDDHTVRAAEDCARSAAVDFEKRFGIKPTPRLVDHAPLAVGVLALIVAVFALAR